MAEPATEDLTPTVRAVADEFARDRVTAQQLTEAILRRHPAYGGGREILWPATPRQVPLERWLDDARAAFTKEAHGPLHGRIAILGAGLADPPSARAMARAGLFHALGEQLSPPLWDGLTAEGRDRLEEIPVLVAAAGIALGAVELGVPVAAVTFNPSGNLIAAARGLGWIVLTRARRQELSSGDIREPVTRVAFGPDARLIVSAGKRAGLVPVREGAPEWEEWAGETLAVGSVGDRALVATSDLQVVQLPGGPR